MGQLGNGPSLQWAEFAMGRDVQLPFQTNFFLGRHQSTYGRKGLQFSEYIV